ncbi:hypothetical protein PUN28_002505 [Cardiocondyla obscurior]|uniref:Uncharacterized protein n=1 Tax=Cardiocondyla obscurior TaxID=286306 RepID=A0AAW2GUR1_9HYME
MSLLLYLLRYINLRINRRYPTSLEGCKMCFCALKIIPHGNTKLKLHPAYGNVYLLHVKTNYHHLTLSFIANINVDVITSTLNIVSNRIQCVYQCYAPEIKSFPHLFIGMCRRAECT